MNDLFDTLPKPSREEIAARLRKQHEDRWFDEEAVRMFEHKADDDGDPLDVCEFLALT